MTLNHNFYVVFEKFKFITNLKKNNNKRTLVNLYKDIVLVNRQHIFCTTLFINNNKKTQQKL